MDNGQLTMDNGQWIIGRSLSVVEVSKGRHNVTNNEQLTMDGNPIPIYIIALPESTNFMVQFMHYNSAHKLNLKQNIFPNFAF